MRAQLLAEKKYYLFFFHILMLMSPVIIWPVIQYVNVFALFAFLVAFRENFVKVKVEGLVLFILIFLSVFVYKLLLGASFFGSAFFSVVISSLSLLKRSQFLTAFLVFRKMLVLVLVPGIVVWFIHLITGNVNLFKIWVVPDNYVMHEHKVSAGYQYIVYPFLVRIDFGAGEIFYRFQSVFDEPGYLGTICALVLLVNQGSVKRYDEKIILLSGLVSFSLAFYLIMIFFILAKAISNPKRSITFFFIFATLVSLMYSMVPEYINDRIGNRMAFNESGISGNNRSSGGLDSAFRYWLYDSTEKEFLLGVDGFEDDGSSSLKQVPVFTGFVGSFFLVSIYAFFSLRCYCYSRVNFDTLIFIVIFAISSYQRPQIENAIYIFIFICGWLFSLESRQIDRREVVR